MTEEERQLIVRECVAEAIPIDVEEVSLDSLILTELGADSLSLLDLVFRLEEAFDIEITRGELERAARGGMSDDEFAPDGVISDVGLERLRALMPEADAQIKPGLKPMDIVYLFSVRTFLRMVEAKLAEQPAS